MCNTESVQVFESLPFDGLWPIFPSSISNVMAADILTMKGDIASVAIALNQCPWKG